MIIKALYEPRDDLDTYPWLKPLLFSSNAYALNIPEDEWPQYGEGDWSKERYEGVEKALKRTRKACLDNPDTWGNKAIYHEISIVAFCKMDGSTYLQFNLIGKKMDGRKFGESTKRLKLVGDKWVNPYEPAVGRKRSTQLNQCYVEALALVEKGELATIPINELKKKTGRLR